MKIDLRGNKKPLIALAVAVSGYLLISQLVLPQYDALRERSSSVAEKEDQLRRYRRALVSKDQYARLLERAAKSVGEGEARLIRGDNPSLASVELQTIVEEAAKKLNIPLGPRTMTPAKRKDEHFNEITMTFSFESTLNQMTSFLGELRASPKFVTVRNLQVVPVESAQEPPVRGGLKKTVKVNLTLSGVLLTPSVAVR